MIAVGVEDKRKGNWFFLQPSPGSRKTQLIAVDERTWVSEKQFVSNRHVLLQFESKSVPDKDEDGCIVHDVKTAPKKKPQTVIFEANGKIVTQSVQV